MLFYKLPSVFIFHWIWFRWLSYPQKLHCTIILHTKKFIHISQHIGLFCYVTRPPRVPKPESFEVTNEWLYFKGFFFYCECIHFEYQKIRIYFYRENWKSKEEIKNVITLMVSFLMKIAPPPSSLKLRKKKNLTTWETSFSYIHHDIFLLLLSRTGFIS
jgi:hypothetical protein